VVWSRGRESTSHEITLRLALYTSEGTEDMELVLSTIPTKVTPTMNNVFTT
jgi:hypothetical protein